MNWTGPSIFIRRNLGAIDTLGKTRQYSKGFQPRTATIFVRTLSCILPRISLFPARRRGSHFPHQWNAERSENCGRSYRPMALQSDRRLGIRKYGANSPLHKIRSHMAGSTGPAGPTPNPRNLSQKEDSTVRLGLSPMDSSSRPFHLAASPSSNGPSAL
jgi:hypothetical protein